MRESGAGAAGELFAAGPPAAGAGSGGMLIAGPAGDARPRDADQENPPPCPESYGRVALVSGPDATDVLEGSRLEISGRLRSGLVTLMNHRWHSISISLGDGNFEMVCRDRSDRTVGCRRVRVGTSGGREGSDLGLRERRDDLLGGMGIPQDVDHHQLGSSLQAWERRCSDPEVKQSACQLRGRFDGRCPSLSICNPDCTGACEMQGGRDRGSAGNEGMRGSPGAVVRRQDGPRATPSPRRTVPDPTDSAVGTSPGCGSPRASV